MKLEIMKKAKKFISSFLLGLVLMLKSANGKIYEPIKLNSDYTQVITFEKSLDKNLSKQENQFNKDEESFLKKLFTQKQKRRRCRLISKKKAETEKKKNINMTVPSIFGLVISTLLIMQSVEILAQTEKLTQCELLRIKNFLVRNKKKLIVLFSLLILVGLVYLNRTTLLILLQKIISFFNSIMPFLLSKEDEPVISDEVKIHLIQALKAIKEKRVKEIRLKKLNMLVEMLSEKYQNFQKNHVVFLNQKDLLKKSLRKRMLTDLLKQKLKKQQVIKEIKQMKFPQNKTIQNQNNTLP